MGRSRQPAPASGSIMSCVLAGVIRSPPQLLRFAVMPTHAANPQPLKVNVSATHQAAVPTGVLAACQRVGVRVFASSAILSGCADASCGSTSSR